jgi:hypothetical protein
MMRWHFEPTGLFQAAGTTLQELLGLDNSHAYAYNIGLWEVIL